jgi:hypothetical protein
LEKKEEVHLVKKVCKELGLNYRELGEKIGYSESNLRKSVHLNRLSPPLKKSIELYLEVINFQKKEEETKAMKNTLREFLTKLNLEK